MGRPPRSRPAAGATAAVTLITRRPAAIVVATALLVALASAGIVPAATAPNNFTRGVVEGRTYRLYVPAPTERRPATTPLPLVVALHGCWQTAEDFATGTRLNEIADKRGVLVLYPVQSRRDNPSRCWNWFDPEQTGRSHGEIAQILAIVDEIGKTHAVDRARVVALGLSAGGFEAVNLLCAAPDVIAGVGVASGGPYRCGVGVVGGLQCMRGFQVDGNASAAACLGAMGGKVNPHVRASLWQGEDDSLVNPTDLAALATMFATLTKSTPAPPEPKQGATYTLYRDATGRPTIETWLITAMGHAWSGGDERATLTFPPGPPATDRMLDFLLPDAK